MKTAGISLLIFMFSISGFGQEKDQDASEKRKPEVKTEIKKEFDENGNLYKYDSVYTWKWSDEGSFNEEFFKNFEEHIGQFQRRWEGFGEGFMSRFYLDDKALKKFKDIQEDFELNFPDSIFFEDHFEDFFNDDRFPFQGFNFNGENLENMPFNKEKMDELQKRMKDLLNGEYDERIRKFIEEHKREIDEIKYQINESIPRNRKAI